MNHEISYTQLKALISSKEMHWQYIEEDTKYTIFSKDSSITYKTIVFKSGYASPDEQAQHDTDREDFEDNYKPTANKPLRKDPTYVFNKSVNFAPRAWVFTHNLCDKTTWHPDSIRVVDEAVGTGDGATTVFALDHDNIIDLVHGKITDEDYLVPTAAQTGTTYHLIVKVDGVTKTERAYCATSGGDYECNYSTGEITFYTAPANGLEITASYFYATTSTIYITPRAGYKYVLTKAEAQFSKNIDMNNNLIVGTYVYNPYDLPNRVEMTDMRITYKRIWDFIAYTNGSYPIIPAFGGSSRGITQDVIQLRYEYVSSLELQSSYGTQVRVWLEEEIPYDGDFCTITFYGYEEEE